MNNAGKILKFTSSKLPQVQYFYGFEQVQVLKQDEKLLIF